MRYVPAVATCFYNLCCFLSFSVLIFLCFKDASWTCLRSLIVNSPTLSLLLSWFTWCNCLLLMCCCWYCYGFCGCGWRLCGFYNVPAVFVISFIGSLVVSAALVVVAVMFFQAEM